MCPKIGSGKEGGRVRDRTISYGGQVKISRDLQVFHSLFLPESRENVLLFSSQRREG